MEYLYFNGDIVTMERQDDTPEAVLVCDGFIKAVGTYETLVAECGDQCVMVDMAGNTLMPSFVDAHSHIFTASLQYLTNVILEDANNFEDIATMLKNHIEKNHIPAGQTVCGCLYDHNFLEEGVHPDKRLLDAVSTEHPIVIAHASGHCGVANSLALERAGINADTPTPEGGCICRYPNSNEPSGVLEESAFITTQTVNTPQVSDWLSLVERCQEIYAANGITTLQDGGVIDETVGLFRHLGEMGRLKLDVVAYAIMMCEGVEGDPSELLEKHRDVVGTYKNHFKIGGYKVVLDGSPQGKTAWLTKPYENSGDYCGYPWFKDEQVRECVRLALKDNQQLLAHCNGDAASDQFINMYEAEWAASDNPNKDKLRPVMIHCQTVRDDQLDRMTDMNMIPSIFVGHTYFWGDIHLNLLGQERGRRISPVRSALERNLMYNFHTDTPITQPNMLQCVWAASNRVTRRGVTIGKEQCIDVYDALKGITINAAYAYGEEDAKGSIKVGKRADLVLLDANPLKIDKMAIRDIRVLETIKDGETIYRRTV